MKAAELNGVLEQLELDVDPDSLRDAIGCFERFSAKLADAVGGFDKAKLFELDGFTSTNNVPARRRAQRSRRRAAHCDGAADARLPAHCGRPSVR
jgi:hypothetical protein